MSPFNLDVEPSTTHRRRVIGSSSLAFMTSGIDDHELTVVKKETAPLKPIKVQFLDVGISQSYSVSLKTKSMLVLATVENNNGLFWMVLTMRYRSDGLFVYGI